MNPPYATSSNFTEGDKAGTTSNKVNDEMSLIKMGQAQKQLYTQFMWRIDSLSGNMNIAIFSKTMFMTSVGFKKFRSEILKKYEYKFGFLMDSSNFADVKSWGLGFTIWDKK